MPERNDPCPCGSNKKFKKCCLISQEDSKVEDLSYRRDRELEIELGERLLDHAIEFFGKTALMEAWCEFHCWEYSENFDPEDPMNQLVLPYFFFSWTLDPAETSCPLKLENTTVCESFLACYKKRLSTDEQNLLKASNRPVFSFYEVTEVSSGHGFKLRDVFTREYFDVVEKLGSQGVTRGSILFASLFSFNNRYQILAMSPLLLPATSLATLERVRSDLHDRCQVEKLGEHHIAEFDIELREVYFELLQPLLNPTLPELFNTDGEPLIMQTLHFEIDSADVVFNGLKDLSTSDETGDHFKPTVKIEDGRLVHAEITWFKSLAKKYKHKPNTTLGIIEITPEKLTIEVNSEQRAKMIKNYVKKNLGSKVRYITKVIHNVKANPLETQKSPKPAKPELAYDQLDPETQASIKKMVESHWQNWFNQKIPALNNLTPNQAKKTVEGRELLEALLNYYASSDKPVGNMGNLFQPDLAYLRAQLGLNPR